MNLKWICVAILLYLAVNSPFPKEVNLKVIIESEDVELTELPLIVVNTKSISLKFVYLLI